MNSTGDIVVNTNISSSQELMKLESYSSTRKFYPSASALISLLSNASNHVSIFKKALSGVLWLQVLIDLLNVSCIEVFISS